MKCSDSRMLLTSRVGTKNPAQFYPPGFIRFYPAGKTQKNRVILGFIKKQRNFQENSQFIETLDIIMIL